MLSEKIIDVTGRGAVILGPDVVCDGFHFGPKARVQSHVHLDHMNDFETSKGLQKIIMSPETYDLIVLEKDADIPYRANIKVLKNAETISVGDCEITLIGSGHMMGAVQVQVSLPDGTRLGYSGDFSWPLGDTIKVDALVVDCTCGGLGKSRKYTQDEANSRLVDLVSSMLKDGPVVLKAHRGTLQRALDVLDHEIETQVVCTNETCMETEIYQRHGYSIPHLYTLDSSEGKRVMEDGKYILVVRSGERTLNTPSEIPTIILSAYMGNPKEPVLEYNERCFRVALTGHADFNDTLSYIQATGAQLVVTDNTRGGHAVELALEIESTLGIPTRPSTNRRGRGWD
jgi:putative mRNA 3-end processing factor